MIGVLWLVACVSEPAPTPIEPSTEPAAARELALVYSHDLDGEIEPCG